MKIAGMQYSLLESCSLQNELRKQAIQAKFSKAAESYDSYAKVQSEAAQILAAKTFLITRTFLQEINTILEIGCAPEISPPCWRTDFLQQRL